MRLQCVHLLLDELLFARALLNLRLEVLIARRALLQFLFDLSNCGLLRRYLILARARLLSVLVSRLLYLPLQDLLVREDSHKCPIMLLDFFKRSLDHLLNDEFAITELADGTAFRDVSSALIQLSSGFCPLSFTI
mgnify:CR=1 FL=1